MAVALLKLMVVLLILAVPLVAPIAKVVAAPPRLTVVALVLNKLIVELLMVVAIEPPSTVKVPLVEILPVEPVIENLLAKTFPPPRFKALTIFESERSTAVVTTPPTFRPIGKAPVA